MFEPRFELREHIKDRENVTHSIFIHPEMCDECWHTWFRRKFQSKGKMTRSGRKRRTAKEIVDQVIKDHEQ